MFKILVVEDDVPVQNLMMTTLKAHDYKFLLAGNGETAILEAASHNPDIILLDLGLPDMDGVESLHAIRKMGGIFKELPIVLLTANAVSGVKDEMIGEGFDDFLSKPIDIEELQRVLIRFLGTKE